MTNLSNLLRHRPGVDALVELLDGNPEATFRDVVQNVAETGLFVIADSLKAALAGADIEEADEGEEEERTDRDKGIATFLAAPLGRVDYAKYVGDKAHFDTHQGVKGLEFPRVMVIMDDHEARSFLFKYDKLFGGGAEDNQTASTRGLFYVTCQRQNDPLRWLPTLRTLSASEISSWPMVGSSQKRYR
ncbi:hypothetical protein CDEF62S_01603 [Castellaniella defragrans]